MQKNKIENIDILADIDLSRKYSEELYSEITSEQKNEIIVEESLDNNILQDSDIEKILETTNEKVETIDIKDNSSILENIVEDVVLDKKVHFKKKSSFLSWIIFLTKYALTSSLIFGVLLLSTNYSAYINIAKSYIYDWEMKITQQKLISSVEASNIKEKYSKEKIEIIKEEKIEKKESNKLSIKKMKKEQDKENINLNIEITPYENRVIIPKIWKNIPLVDIKNKQINGEKELNDIFMEELEKGIIRYPGSAKPWQDWTSFIFWHSSNFPWVKWDYNDVFALLDKVEFWDEVIIYYWQEKFVYKIREKKVITPGDVSVLERNKKKSEITLMTCWPIWTTLNRLIVVWELIEQK